MPAKIKENQFDLVNYDFSITPISIRFSKARPGLYKLELEKGCQLIAPLQQKISISKLNNHLFKNRQSLKFQLLKATQMNMQWSLYDIGSDQQVNVALIPVNIGAVWARYQEDLKHYATQFNTIVHKKQVGEPLLESLKKLKLQANKHTQYVTSPTRDSSIQIEFKIDIISEYDKIAQKEQSLSALNRSKIQSRVSTPKSKSVINSFPSAIQISEAADNLSNVHYDQELKVQSFIKEVTEQDNSQKFQFKTFDFKKNKAKPEINIPENIPAQPKEQKELAKLQHVAQEFPIDNEIQSKQAERNPYQQHENEAQTPIQVNQQWPRKQFNQTESQFSTIPSANLSHQEIVQTKQVVQTSNKLRWIFAGLLLLFLLISCAMIPKLKKSLNLKKKPLKRPSQIKKKTVQSVVPSSSVKAKKGAK